MQLNYKYNTMLFLLQNTSLEPETLFFLCHASQVEKEKNSKFQIPKQTNMVAQH